MYRAYGLLSPSSDFTLEEAQRRLIERFPQYRVTTNAGQITIASDDWEFELTVRDGPHVLTESQGIAERIGGEEDGSDIATCSRRVEAWSETPDYEMAHFNDYLTVVEVLKSFPGLIAVDPHEPSLL